MCLESYDKEIDNVLYKTYEKRLASFKNWNGKVKPEMLARSGFYYSFLGDICKCFYCGIEIYKWANDDCPIEQHYYFKKNCDLNLCLYLNKPLKCEPIVIKCERPIVIKTESVYNIMFYVLIILFISLICNLII